MSKTEPLFPDGDIPSTDLGKYQEWLAENAKYPEGVTYPVGGMCAESGELLNDLIRIQRKNHRLDVKVEDLGVETWLKFVDEGGDVLAYLVMFCKEMGIDLSQLAAYNKAKLTRKMVSGGFYRTEVGG